MKHKYVDTVWECWSYDVWGNAKDGFDVNDRSCINEEFPIRIRIEVNNPGTPQEFESAYPCDKDIRNALDIKARVKIDTNGDDLNIHARHTSTDYPLGEMKCISHESLSPVRV